MNKENFGQEVANLGNSNTADGKYVEEGFIHMLDPDEVADDYEINHYGITHRTTITKSDGHTYDVFGLLMVPLDFKPEWVTAESVENKYPVMIMCPGFNVGCMVFSDFRADYGDMLIPAGYIGYTFDLVGGSTSGAENYEGGIRTYCVDKEMSQMEMFNSMSVYTNVEDLNLVIDNVKMFKYVDTSKIVLMGASQGGVVSGATAAQREREGKNDIAGLIELYPANCIADYVYQGVASIELENNPDATIDEKKQAYLADPSAYTLNFMGNTMGDQYYIDILENIEYDETMGYYSMLSLGADYSGSVLVVHGTADYAVMLQYSVDALYGEGAIFGDNDAELVILTGAGHSFDCFSSTPKRLKQQNKDAILSYLETNGLLP